MYAKHLSKTASYHGILGTFLSYYCSSYFACGCDKNMQQKQHRGGRADFGSQFEGRQSMVEGMWGRSPRHACSQGKEKGVLGLFLPLLFPYLAQDPSSWIMPVTSKMDLLCPLYSLGNSLTGMCVSQALPNSTKLTRDGDHLDYRHSFCWFPFLFPFLSLLSSPLLAPRALELGLCPLSSPLS